MSKASFLILFNRFSLRSAAQVRPCSPRPGIPAQEGQVSLKENDGVICGDGAPSNGLNGATCHLFSHIAKPMEFLEWYVPVSPSGELRRVVLKRVEAREDLPGISKPLSISQEAFVYQILEGIGPDSNADELVDVYIAVTAACVTLRRGSPRVACPTDISR